MHSLIICYNLDILREPVKQWIHSARNFIHENHKAMSGIAMSIYQNSTKKPPIHYEVKHVKCDLQGRSLYATNANDELSKAAIRCSL